MEYTLKDYQADAVADVLQRLDSAKTLYRAPRPQVSSFALTATTGAGKTVMAAAVIESLFFGNDELDISPDPSAVILWFCDDPSLNEQTRHRLTAASDKLDWADTTVIEHPFSVEKLRPGKVYFLNTDKLAEGGKLVRGHVADDEDRQIPSLRASVNPDLQGYTIWETLANTINDPNQTVIMVLDEAHRGFGRRTSENKPTIVRRLINGHAGIPPMPVVWGISATVERFEAAMSDAGVAEANRWPLPKVIVEPAQVQASGLLKDTIVLDIPAETGKVDTVLLRRGAEKTRESTQAWAEYAASQAPEGGSGSPTDPVIPLMVLQLPNRPVEDDVARALRSIFQDWPDLQEHQVAHCLGQHTTQTYGPFQVRYIAPEQVEDDTSVRVLLAKDAISTGWDCPRAEVLVSFRPAKDATHITQLLGRMVRTPLARRVPGNDVLNSVNCILPLFDKVKAKAIAQAITGSREDFPYDGDTGRKVLIDPQLMTPNPVVSEAVWAALEALPSESLPRKNARPVKRLTALAHALAHDELRPGAGRDAHRSLHGVLDGLRARFAEDLQRAVDEVLTVRGTTLTATKDIITEGTFTEVADDRTIRDAFRQAGRIIAPDIAGTYVDHVTGEGDDDDLRDAHVTVSALATLPTTGPELDRAADELTHTWLDTYRVDIKDLSDERQTVYNDIRAMSKDPQRMVLTRPRNTLVETKVIPKGGGDPVALATQPKHLLADEEGQYPVGGENALEQTVIATEITRSYSLGWYRNPSRSSQDSLGIAYQDNSEGWHTMHPDFVFFDQASPDAPARASIVDPHGHWLGDSDEKLRAMAAFAAQYGHEFHRIETVSTVNDQAKVLDIQDPGVRQAIDSADDATSLYSGPLARNY